MQIGKKFPNKGMNRETKATVKISLVKTNLIGIGVISPFFVTQDPNFYKIRELKSIIDSLLILLGEGTRDSPIFIGGGKRSSFQDHAIIRRR